MIDQKQPTADADWSRGLVALLERQHELVDRLGGLADRQAGLVEQQQTDALLQLLGERERIIEQFTRSQEEMNAYTGDLDTRLPTLEDGERDRIQMLIGSIGSRLEDVMKRDAQDQQALETARSAVRQELSGLDRARMARDAYRGAPTGTNRFADRKG